MMHSNFFKKSLSCLLAVSLIFCGNILLIASAEQQYDIVSVPGDDGAAVALPAENEKVSVIVELESNTLLERDSDIFSGGEFSASAKRLQESILAEQQAIQKKIEKTVLGEKLDIRYSYSLLTNGFATEVYPSQIDDIAEISGVSSVYIPPVFEALEAQDELNITDSGKIEFDFNKSAGSYTGAGEVIAIVDTGINITHEAFSVAPASPEMTQSDIQGVLSQLHAYNTSSGTAASYYYSAKIPFFYNYANKDFDVSHVNVASGDHGTHVAGIAAGCAKDSGGNIKFSGVAPDAQLLIMKVFKSSTSASSTGASAADLIAAVEDAAVLGADVVNYSLGSMGGFSYVGKYPSFYELFDELADLGIEAVAASGNYYTAGYGNLYGNDLSLASNPDNGTIGTPASFVNNLAVASFRKQQFIVSNGREMEFTNNYTDSSRCLEKFINQTKQLALLTDASGTLLTGTQADFDSYAALRGVSGKFVMIRRGQNYIDTVARAQACGAVGLIVCNNREGVLSNMAENTNVSIPAIFISQADGNYIVANYSSCQSFAVQYSNDGQMSAFSSVGVTPDLQLKPEISAIGDTVYSSTDNNTYGLKSGTSMAAPYVTGVYAVMLQYVNSQYASYVSSMTAKEKRDFITKLLMSTAAPITDGETNTFYSPRRQGAGAINAAAAMESKGYITTSSNGIPKLNLGDDKQKSGIYTMSFKVYNMSDFDIEYTVNTSVLTELVKEQTVTYQTNVLDASTGEYKTATLDEKFMSGSTKDLTAESTATISDDGTIVVPGSGFAEVSVTVELAQSAKNYMDTMFENGIYVDGFVFLDGGTDTSTLSVPFLAFYGDWTKAPMIDDGSWLDTLAGTETYPQFGTNTMYTFTKSTDRALSELYEIGTDCRINSADAYANSGVSFDRSRLAIASRAARPTMTSGELWNNTIYKTKTYLLRSAATLVYEVKNSLTGEVYGTSTVHSIGKTYYKSSISEIIYAGYESGDGFTWNGKTQGGMNIPDGTRVTVSATASADYGDGGKAANVNRVLSFEAVIDSEAPKVMSAEFSRDGSGNAIADFSLKDNHFLRSATVTVRGLNSDGVAASESSTYFFDTDENQFSFLNVNLTALAGDTVSKILSAEIEVDDTAGNGRFNNCGSATDGRYIYCFNESVALTSSDSSVAEGSILPLSCTAQLYLSPSAVDGKNDNESFSVNTAKFSSSAPEIASVDSDGNVLGIHEGTAVITVADDCSGETDSINATVTPNILRALINSAEVGATVTHPVGSYVSVVTIDKDITVDLNGANIDSFNDLPAITITNGANVTLKNGTVTNTVSAGNYLRKLLSQPSAIMVASGTLTLENMVVSGEKTDENYNEFTSVKPFVGSGVRVANGAFLNVKKSEIYGFYAVNNDIGGSVTLTDGWLGGTFGAVKNYDDVTATSHTIIYDVSEKASETPSDGTNPLAICAAVNGEQFSADVEFLGGTVNVGVKYNKDLAASANGEYSYSWIPQKLLLYKDGVFVDEADCSESKQYELFTFENLTDGNFTVEIEFVLDCALTETQSASVTASLQPEDLSEIISYLSSAYISDAMELSSFISSVDSIYNTLNSLESLYAERDLLGVDCPLTQEVADAYMDGYTGLGISDEYGYTWTEYYNNCVKPMLFGGIETFVSSNGEYLLNPTYGEEYNGIMPILDAIRNSQTGKYSELIAAIDSLQVTLTDYYPAADIAEQLAAVAAGYDEVCAAFSQMKSLVKSDFTATVNSNDVDVKLLDTLLSEFAADGEAVTAVSDKSEYALAISTLCEWTSSSEIFTCNDVFNFNAVSDSECNLNIINACYYANNLSRFVSSGHFRAFSEIKQPSSIGSGYRITYLGTEEAENPNPQFFVTGEALILADAQKAGYSFVGWYSSEQMNESDRVTEISADNAENVTLYAKFSINSYYLRFIADGETLSETLHQFGEPIDIITPTLPTKDGFMGYWDRFVPETMTPGDCDITAIYFALKNNAEVPVSVAVIGSGGYATVNDAPIKTNSCHDYAINTEIELTAVETAAGSFLYWVRRDTNRIVSSEKSYTFTAATYADYEAVFCEVEEYRNVTYCGSSGNILMSVETTVGDGDITPPEIPVLDGFNVIGWDKTVDEYKTVSGNVLVTAQYQSVVQKYTVTLTNTSNVTGGGEYDALSTVTIAASGDDFSYWTNENGTIVSYQPVYSFIICFDCTFTAVFEGTVAEQPVIRISRVAKNYEEKNLTFYSERSIPEEYTIVQSGMILTNIESIGEDPANFVLENVYVIKGTAESTLNLGTYSVMITDYVETDTYYARAYVILSDSENNVLDTIYSDVAYSLPDW